MDFELVFTDTQAELPELYAYLDRLAAFLNRPILRLPSPGFENLLQQMDYFLPSPWARWCTDRLKIRPFRKYLGSAEATVYVALTAAEAYRRDKLLDTPHLRHRYPFVEAGLGLREVVEILQQRRLANHPLYRLKSRSGCYCCFFQSLHAWRRLWEHYPHLFDQVAGWEEEHRARHGHTYGYVRRNLTLRQLEERFRAQLSFPFEEEDDYADACTICRY